MTPEIKFSAPEIDPSVEFAHPDVWQRERGEGWARLRIGARRREIPLILELCRDLKGPFGVLYVLLVSRLGRDPARYQNPQPIGYEELELFLYTFQEFFEQDGRHHLWVMSLGGEGQFIFDNHNFIYAYGDLDRYEFSLKTAGFAPGLIEIPAPHSHHYHPAFDGAEDALMGYWEWAKYPLDPDDDP